MAEELTLESLAKRVEALERELRGRETRSAPNDWMRVVGIFTGSEVSKQIDAEVAAARQAERDAMLAEEPEQ